MSSPRTRIIEQRTSARRSRKACAAADNRQPEARFDCTNLTRDATRAYRRAYEPPVGRGGGSWWRHSDVSISGVAGRATKGFGLWPQVVPRATGWIVQPAAMPLRIVSVAVSCTGVDAGQTKRAGSGELSFVLLRPSAWNVEKRLIDFRRRSVLGPPTEDKRLDQSWSPAR